MENFMNQMWDQVAAYINAPYLLSFMFLSYAVKRYLQTTLTQLIGSGFKIVYVVLIIAALVAIPYLVLVKISWQQILFSYAFGTSLHELVFSWIEKKFTS